MRNGSGSDRAEHRTYNESGAARPRGRDRTGLAAGPLSRRAAPLCPGGSGARWSQHAAALALVPHRFAGDGARTRNRMTVNSGPAITPGPFAEDAMNIEVKILRNEHGKPPDKLADVEIHFVGGEL